MPGIAVDEDDESANVIPIQPHSVPEFLRKPFSDALGRLVSAIDASARRCRGRMRHVVSLIRERCERGCGLIRRCRRYHRLIDRTPRIWFHVLEENNMKPFVRLTHRASFRAGTIVL